MRTAARRLAPTRLGPTLALGLALALAACATVPAPLEIAESSACRADYLGIDAKVEAQHAVNAGAHRIEGFPYLRSDRFLASFRGEVPDGPRFETWVERLRALDLASRASELRNTGWSDPAEELAHLDRCGKAWAVRDLADAARREQLRQNAAVPDDYSLLKRTLGVYPLLVPFLNLGMRNFDKDVVADYARPVEQLESPGLLTLWQPSDPPAASPAASPAAPPPAARWLAQRDALGVPQLDAAQWQALARAHLPRWQLETAGEFDKPGAPMLGTDGPRLDLAQPVTYFAPAYTRRGGRVFAQLVYVVWFSERPAEGLLNAYSGVLDGVVWRVTLDEQGAPLLYDTVHTCGCYHYYFPAQLLKRKEQGGFWDEPVLFPQASVPAEPFAIRLATGTHFVRRLVPLAQARADAKAEYSLRDYGALLSLPSAAEPRSLFGEDGLVDGTDRRERLWLWPAGIKSAGAMRQLGRHPTSFVGRSHFDDPDLLDKLFER